MANKTKTKNGKEKTSNDVDAASIEEVKKLKDHASRLSEEAAKAAEEAAKMAEKYGLYTDEYETDDDSTNIGYAHDGRADIVKPDRTLDVYLQQLVTLKDDIAAYLNKISLTRGDRSRLLGSGVRRLGFIEKVTDTAQENPEFMPAFFDLAEMQRLARLIEVLRVIRTTSQTIDRVANDALLVAGHDSYQQALMYYNYVKEMARRGVIGAMEIFKMLELFFRRGRISDVEEVMPLTQKETLREAKKFIKGKADGKMVLEGRPKRITPASHAVVEDIRKPEVAFTEKVSGIICHQCNTNNPLNARYCINCATELKR